MLPLSCDDREDEVGVVICELLQLLEEAEGHTFWMDILAPGTSVQPTEPLADDDKLKIPVVWPNTKNMEIMITVNTAFILIRILVIQYTTFSDYKCF